MKTPSLTGFSTVHLVGGGFVDYSCLKSELANATCIVAVDGGAGAVLEAGFLPDLVVGDLDSLDAADRSAIPADRIVHISEQDSTDFDKALRHISALLTEAHGFLGKRSDHGLAALNVLARYPDKRCILHAENDLIMLCPPDLKLQLPAGCRVSVFPMAPVTGRSIGLRWPIDGIEFTPWGRIGTSNEATGPVHLNMDDPGMLLILPPEQLDALRSGLRAAPMWPDA